LRNATNATTAEQPIYTTNAINGNGAVEFDGSNDRLIGPSVAWGTVATVFFVAKTDDTAGAKGQYVFWDGNTSTGGVSFHFGVLYGYATFFGRGWSPGNPYAKSNVLATAGAWLMGSSELSSASNLWVDGRVPTSTSVGNGSMANLSYAFCIGFENFWRFDGQIGLVAIFGSSLSASLRRRYESAAAYSFKLACS
jgi:hypothetical protein